MFKQTQSMPRVCKGNRRSSNVTKTKGKVVEVGQSLFFGWARAEMVRPCRDYFGLNCD